MNMIDVIGGKESQKEIAFNVVAKMIDELMPRLRTLEITVRIKDVKDAIAYCMMEDNNRQFEIEISRNLSLRDFVTALCHEMVHVKQFARKELCAEVSGSLTRWKKSKVSESTDYWDLPWEKEAYRMESKLAQICWDADIL
jgi:hypothetical protein|tara:strand:- start:79 stop:501 length:423 start_codon:yes stop_codon:yes gene_type:complete